MKELIVSAKTKTVLLYITVALVIYSLVGFLIIPAVLKNQIPKIANEKLNRVAQIKDIEFNPFSLALNLHGFDLKNLDKSSFFSFEKLNVNIAFLKSIANLTLTIDQISLDQPNTLIKRYKKGDFNFTDLLSTEEPVKNEEEKDDSLFPIIIVKTAISKGKLTWEDDFYSHPQKETIYPLDLNLNQFTTKVNKQSQMEFALALTSGGELNWKGDLVLTPLKSIGKIKLHKVNFKKVWELFLQDSVNFEILKGSEVIEIDYHLNDTKKGLQFLIKDAHVDINELQISEKGKTDSLINIPDFKVSGITMDLLKKNVAISKVSAADAQFKAWLNSEGVINYQTLFSSNTEQEKKSAQKPSPPEKNEKPWTISLAQLEINDFAFNFTDRSLASTPAIIDLTSINLSATDLSNKPNAKLPFKLGIKVNNAGSLNIDGTVVSAPFSSDMKINADNIALKDFQPYLNAVARLDLISGLFNLDANISMLQEENKPFGLKFTGDSHINEFVTRDQVSSKDFLKWNLLEIKKIDVDLAANSYLIDSINIDKLYSRVLIRKNKKINVTDILVKKDKKEPVEKEQSISIEEVKPTFKIAHFTLTNGISDFTDRSLILPFSAHISQLKGTIKGISSEQNAVIKVKLDGKVSNLAPVHIRGTISPNQGDSDISLDFKSMPMPLMTPYMAEFAGRKIEKGNMSLNLKYNIQNKKLSATNNLLIDQLVLGDTVENPKAVSLRLDLAIALLSDADGKIKLDMPITGSLDDPQFSVSGLIFDTLVNVLTKIISSPFNAVASLIGSEEDISTITFLPGESTLDDKQKEKLGSLATALEKRPALKLEIKGAAFKKEDWPHLQAEALDKKLLKIRAEELSKESGKTVMPEHLKYSKEENQRILADLFIKEFPTQADRSLFGTPRLIDSEKDFYEVAQSKMAALIKPNTQRLEKLAVARAQAISKHLSTQKIAIDRVYLLNVVVDPKDAENVIAAKLNLTVN